MAKYQIETEDGKKYIVETEDKSPEKIIPEKQGLISKGWDILSTPEKMSREGLGKLAGMVPSVEPTGNTFRDIALNTPKILAESVAEVAPSFISPESIATAGTLKGLKVAAPAIRAGGRGLAQAAESISGLEYKTPGVLKDVFNKPSLLFAKGKESIGKFYAKIADAKALNEGILDIKNISDKKEVVEKAIEAAKEGLLNADEALVARKELFALKKSFPNEYFNNAYKILGEVAKTKYGELDTLFKEAVKAEALRKLFPTNKLGGTSVGKLFLGTLAPPLGAASSPLVQSVTSAGAGMVAKGAKPFIQNPVTSSAISSLFNIGEERTNGKGQTAKYIGNDKWLLK